MREMVAVVGLTLAFAWGLAAGAYEVFPYHIVRSIKNAVDGEDGSRDPDAYIGNPHASMQNKSDLQWEARAPNVMVGDSITASGRWSEMFPAAVIVNRGLGGDTIGGVRERLPSILAVQPRKVFLMVGINDAFFRNPPEKVVAHYTAVVDALRSRTQVVIQSTLECRDGPVCTVETRGRVRTVNQHLRKLAADRGLAFIDLNRTMSDAGGLKSAYSWDGIHLNGEGYTAWRAALAPHLEKPD